MLDIAEQLRHYADAVVETVDAPAAPVDSITTQAARPRRPLWQPVVAAAAVVALLVGGLWFAGRSSDSTPSDQNVAAGGDEIQVGVATVLIPEGMKLEELGNFDQQIDTPPVTGSDGSVVTHTIVTRARARLSTTAGMCTITSSRGDSGGLARARNNEAIERFNNQLAHVARARTSLDRRVKALNQQLAALAAGSDDAASLASQRDAALKQIDSVNQEALALSQVGPDRPAPPSRGFEPADASRTTWQAQPTRDDLVEVTCPDAATALQLVDATTLPDPAP